MGLFLFNQCKNSFSFDVRLLPIKQLGDSLGSGFPWSFSFVAIESVRNQVSWLRVPVIGFQSLMTSIGLSAFGLPSPYGFMLYL